MATLIKQITGVLCLAAMGTGTLYAQKPADKQEDNIIIRKKGNADEKMTIVIDGDKITINGKPLDQYKDSSFEIQRFKKDVRFFMHDAPPAPFARGGADKFRGRINVRPVENNRALLGVITEKHEKGAKVAEVTAESAAAKAGLQKDDIITAIDDTTVSDNEALSAVIRKYKPEDKVKITYLRDGKKGTATAILGKNNPSIQHFNWDNDNNSFHFEMPDMAEFPNMPEMRSFNRRGLGGRDLLIERSWKPRLGLQVQDTEEGKGVKVLSTGENTPADKAGLKKEDIVTAVNGKKIQSVDELREQLKEVKEGDTVTLDFLRGNESKSVQVKFPKKLKTTNL